MNNNKNDRFVNDTAGNTLLPRFHIWRVGHMVVSHFLIVYGSSYYLDTRATGRNWHERVTCTHAIVMTLHTAAGNIQKIIHKSCQLSQYTNSRHVFVFTRAVKVQCPYVHVCKSVEGSRTHIGDITRPYWNSRLLWIIPFIGLKQIKLHMQCI